MDQDRKARRSQLGDNDYTPMLEVPTISSQLLELRPLSSSQPRPPLSSEPAGFDKPLPSPNTWGRVSIGTAYAKHQVRQRLRPIVAPVRALGTGWRATISAVAGIAASVLFLNVILLVWGSTKPWDIATSTRTLAAGDCSHTQNIFTYSHLVINVLSTILLGSSNAAMQCLCAPTREAVCCRLDASSHVLLESWKT